MVVVSIVTFWMRNYKRGWFDSIVQVVTTTVVVLFNVTYFVVFLEFLKVVAQNGIALFSILVPVCLCFVLLFLFLILHTWFLIINSKHIVLTIKMGLSSASLIKIIGCNEFLFPRRYTCCSLKTKRV